MQELLKIGHAVLSDITIVEISTIIIQLVMMIVLFTLVHKITALRKQIKMITTRVEEYLSSIIESEEKTEQEDKIRQYQRQQEKQNQLINSVLEEIFP